MSHFAEIYKNNKVIRVLVGDNNLPDEGYQWFIDNLGGTWIKTSYNNRIRFNFASVNYIYDEVRDGFIPPKCHDEAVVNDKCLWDCTNAEHDTLAL
jgi:hypothetical protein